MQVAAGTQNRVAQQDLAQYVRKEQDRPRLHQDTHEHSQVTAQQQEQQALQRQDTTAMTAAAKAQYLHKAFCLDELCNRQLCLYAFNFWFVSCIQLQITSIRLYSCASNSFNDVIDDNI